MLYHLREGKNKANANSACIVYFLAKLRNIFDEAFFIDVSIQRNFQKRGKTLNFQSNIFEKEKYEQPCQQQFY